jgi:hypothetical protein
MRPIRLEVLRLSVVDNSRDVHGVRTRCRGEIEVSLLPLA